MSQHNIVVIGASAGGIPALKQLVRVLPYNLPASIFVVVHIPPETPSNLPTILRRASALEVVHPRFHEPIRHGYIYVAPPNWHLTLKDGQVHLNSGPLENHSRPAVDPLFRSAAQEYGTRVIGIVLSGGLDDGTAGLAAIKARGGITIVQDPDEAEMPSMPRSAIENVVVDYIHPVADIAALLVQLIKSSNEEQVVMHPEDESTNERGNLSNPTNLQTPTWSLQFSCPNCNGVLLPKQDGTFVHFQCEVGHSYSPQTLMSDQSENIEAALWMAVRALEEKARLSEHMSQQIRERGYETRARSYEEDAQTARTHAQAIQQLLTTVNTKKDLME